jgi:ferredoxin
LKPCIEVKDRARVEECVDCDACEPVCPVEAIYYEDDLLAEMKPYLADNEAFIAETLPGRDAPLSSPGGAGKIGPPGINTPLVTPQPGANHSARA